MRKCVCHPPFIVPCENVFPRYDNNEVHILDGILEEDFFPFQMEFPSFIPSKGVNKIKISPKHLVISIDPPMDPLDRADKVFLHLESMRAIYICENSFDIGAHDLKFYRY